MGKDDNTRWFEKDDVYALPVANATAFWHSVLSELLNPNTRGFTFLRATLPKCDIASVEIGGSGWINEDGLYFDVPVSIMVYLSVPYEQSFGGYLGIKSFIDDEYEGLLELLEKHISPYANYLLGINTVEIYACVQGGQSVNNNNPYMKEPVRWEGMSFNSMPERKIAEALDRAGVMYLPNCLARVGTPSQRLNRFPDFLICFEGKWGILEVDGRKHHNGRATEDYERNRIIEKHGGIAYFTRYDYERCVADPDGVVKEFLDILKLK